MSYLHNDPSDFADEMVEGFVLAHAEQIRRVEGGIVRAAGTPPGQVAVVIGGGSGHYPAFAGLVGSGLAHGAAVGNVFASPSARQIHSVAVAAASDAGVLFSYGNYAGDVLNFDHAQEQLNAQGIPTRTVVVTDDLSSAPPSMRNQRRGIAGDLAVFRAAAWAAEQGRSLDEVWTLADRANARTRTLGVAFSGCTLPGEAAPLFAVPPGQMAVGMGIHGEPGIEQLPIARADALAELLVSRVLADAPEDAALCDRVGLILNGLGSVKSEELYVFYVGVAERLRRADRHVIRPEIGEFATSFEMAGVSLTLMWLDDELEHAWCAPAHAPGYRRDAYVPIAPVVALEVESPASGQGKTPSVASGSFDSRRAAACIAGALRAMLRTFDEKVEELGRLDAVAGDGDHGIGMRRGATAAVEAAENATRAGAGAQTTLQTAADAWSYRAGGTSGALWGVGLSAVAARLDDDGPLDTFALAAGISDAADAIAIAGRAKPGDKTMLDALVPFADHLNAELANEHSLYEAWHSAADQAMSAAAATAGMTARVGRARSHGLKGAQTPDPGATSLALAVRAVAEALGRDGNLLWRIANCAS